MTISHDAYTGERDSRLWGKDMTSIDQRAMHLTDQASEGVAVSAPIEGLAAC